VEIDWNPHKNAELIVRHGIGFEEALVAIAGGKLLDERADPNRERYPHQRQWIIELDGYIWVVAFVMGGNEIFLKTMFPSRKDTRDYLGGRDGKKKD